MSRKSFKTINNNGIGSKTSSTKARIDDTRGVAKVALTMVLSGQSTRVMGGGYDFVFRQSTANSYEIFIRRRQGTMEWQHWAIRVQRRISSMIEQDGSSVAKDVR